MDLFMSLINKRLKPDSLVSLIWNDSFVARRIPRAQIIASLSSVQVNNRPLTRRFSASQQTSRDYRCDLLIRSKKESHSRSEVFWNTHVWFIDCKGREIMCHKTNTPTLGWNSPHPQLTYAVWHVSLVSIVCRSCSFLSLLKKSIRLRRDTDHQQRLSSICVCFIFLIDHHLLNIGPN